MLKRLNITLSLWETGFETCWMWPGVVITTELGPCYVVRYQEVALWPDSSGTHRGSSSSLSPGTLEAGAEGVRGASGWPTWEVASPAAPRKGPPPHHLSPGIGSKRSPGPHWPRQIHLQTLQSPPPPAPCRRPAAGLPAWTGHWLWGGWARPGPEGRPGSPGRRHPSPPPWHRLIVPSPRQQLPQWSEIGEPWDGTASIRAETPQSNTLCVSTQNSWAL